MSKSINRVFLLGNLGRDPEVKYTPQGTAVARVSLATNERFKNKKGEWEDRVEWHTVILWARLAEISKEYCHKGSKVHIEGRLQTRTWEKDGETKYATEVIAEELILLDGKKAEEQKPAGQPNAHGVAVTDEDIPF